MIVVDTNVIVHLVVEGREDTRAVLERDQDWIAPRLWRSEFRNVLARLMREHSVPFEQAVRLALAGEALLEGGEYDVPRLRVLELASQSGCTAYDCEFVALAHDMDVPLVTLDNEVLKAFPRRAISPEEFLAHVPEEPLPVVPETSQSLP